MKRAVVTGAARGIGRELALALARKRGRIALADIDPVPLEQTAHDVRAAGGDAICVRCDVRSDADVATLAARATEWLGDIDLLVNNAGVLVTGDVTALDEADYRRAFDVNVWGVIHGCRHFVPAMKQRRSGSILNVASLAGVITLPHMGAYNASKAAVIALSETLHAELAPHRVTVSVLCPSFTRTNLIEAGSGKPKESALAVGRTIMEKLGARPDHVARVALQAVERGDLYAVPSLHGRFAWSLKRIWPEQFKRLMSLVQHYTERP
jgi:NAD(P)-dependent dehydrogenase (short-subunit alcohol dehydrogenase family)